MTLIAVIAFLLMSVLNICQHSTLMLLTTLGGAAGLLICLMVGHKKQSTKPLESAFLIILLLLFTWYILAGGNDGFSILWVIFVPFMFMMMIDLKKGLILSTYFLLLLFLVFYGPLEFLLQYDYPKMMRLRFPILYLFGFAFSFYSVKEIITARSNLIHAQNELKQSSFHDPATGLKNRTAYTDYANTASVCSHERLSVVFIDVNGLHELNNKMGHAEGDKMLCTIAKLCAEQFPQAAIFRLGGDEFLLISSTYTEEEITDQMAQLDQKVTAEGCTIAYGIEYRQSDFDLEDMVNCADAKMLRNKAEYYKLRDRRAR